MRNIPARPEQNHTRTRHYRLFVLAGRQAAALWLQSQPLSMADFRDLRFRNLIAGLGFLDDFAARRRAFNDAFAASIAAEIVRTSNAIPATRVHAEVNYA